MAKRGRGVQPVSFALQEAWMAASFPSLNRSSRRPLRWFGMIRPTPDGGEYLLEINAGMQPGDIVRVWVREPRLDAGVGRPPHIYADGSLCLYDWRSTPWRADDLIAATIVPWAAEWCFFYETWRDSGKWYGRAAPHTPPKEVERT